jgi:hypothetical protein
VQISGLWIYGANSSITEESRLDPPGLVAWKAPIEKRLLDAQGMRGVVIVSSVAYGDGGGAVPVLLLGSPRDETGNLVMPRHGAAALANGPRGRPRVRLVPCAENDSARGRYVIGDGLNPTVAELTEAAAVAADAPGAVPGSDEETR